MICEHCEYSAHSAPFGNEFLYCKFYNDKCGNLITDKCMFVQKRASCKYFSMIDGTCPKKCARCMFVNPEEHCSDYAKKDALATKDMYQSFMTKCLNKPYEGLSIWDMYPSVTKIPNKPYERKEEEMGEKCNSKVYFRFGDSDYVPFESIGEVTLVGGLVKSNYISCSPRQITPRKVIFSGPKTIVIWEDGTKTIVGCAEGQEYDEYAGFCAALAKKIFGTTSAAKRVMDANKVINSPKEITQKEDIDYRTITYEISENLKKALRECLNGIALMDFQKKIDDISSKAFDSEKEDDKNE